jgi:hypothetical protein
MVTCRYCGDPRVVETVGPRVALEECSDQAETLAFEGWVKVAHPAWWPNAHEDGTHQWGGAYHNAAINIMWQAWQARARTSPSLQVAKSDA